MRVLATMPEAERAIGGNCFEELCERSRHWSGGVVRPAAAIERARSPTFAGMSCHITCLCEQVGICGKLNGQDAPQVCPRSQPMGMLARQQRRARRTTRRCRAVGSREYSATCGDRVEVRRLDHLIAINPWRAANDQSSAMITRTFGRSSGAVGNAQCRKQKREESRHGEPPVINQGSDPNSVMI